jgi:hypothetical protein
MGALHAGFFSVSYGPKIAFRVRSASAEGISPLEYDT